MNSMSKEKTWNEIESRAKEILCIERHHSYEHLAVDYTSWSIGLRFQGLFQLCKRANMNKKQLLDICMAIIAPIIGETSFLALIGHLKKISKDDIYEYFLDPEDFAIYDGVSFELETGTGGDLVALCAFGFFGFLPGDKIMLTSPTLVDMYETNATVDDFQTSCPKESIDAVVYIKKLIANCEEYIDSAASRLIEASAIGEGKLVFGNALRYSKIRLKLDTEKYIKADDLSFITGVNLSTLANIRSPAILKKIDGEFFVLSKDALNFALGIKPNGEKMARTRNRKKPDVGLRENFYTSVWQDQIAHKICVDEWESLQISASTDFNETIFIPGDMNYFKKLS